MFQPTRGMKKWYFLALLLIFSIGMPLFGQDWPSMMSNPKENFYDVQNAFNTYWTGKDTKQKGKGWKPFKRWEWFTEQRVYPSGNRVQMETAMSTYYAQQLNKPENNERGSSSSDWTFLGASTVPSNGGGAGRCNFIRFDPNDPNILWTGSPGGGLWKSTNAGATWVNWNTDYLPVIGCTDIAIVPTNTDTMYLATGDGFASDTYTIGVLKTTDGGLTWNPTGLNWNVTDTKLIRKLLLHPDNHQILIAGTSDGIYRTVDGGDNWAKVQGGDFYDLEFKPGDPTIVYAGSNRFLRSTNGGISWSQVSSGLAPQNQVRRLAIAVTPANPEFVYLLAAESSSNGYKGMYRSENSGGAFVLQSETPNLLGWASDGSDDGGQGWYTLSIAASPTNPNAVAVGGVNIWRSTTGGSTWGLNAHWWGDQAPYVHADIHDMAYLPGSANIYYAATDGGVFRTTDNGNSWTDLSNGLEIAQLYKIGSSATNEELVLSGWQDNGTNRLLGTEWQRVIGGDGMECIVDHSDADVMYGALYYGNIRKSIDGGNDFDGIVDSDGDGVNSGGLWVTPYIMHPTNSQTLLVGKDELYRSIDGGYNWEQLGSFGGAGLIRAIAYAPSNPDVIYAARSNSIHVSTDGGASFSNVSTGLPNLIITYITVSSINPDRVYITYSGYMGAEKVFVSNNRGSVWSNYSTGLPNLPVNCIEYQNGSNNGVYAGTDVGIYYRDATLSSWVPFSNGLPNVVVNELEIHYNSSKIRAATYGRGLWESPLYSGAPIVPVASFTSNPAINCVGSPVYFSNLSENNPLQVSWTFEGGTPATSTQYNPEVTWLTPGTYTISLTVTNVAGSHTETKTIEIKAIPEVTIVPENPTICKGESISLTASGANTFFWTNNLGGGAVKTVTPNATITYTITGNNGGCTSKSTVTVSVNALPQLFISSSTDSVCVGQPVELLVEGATQYEWADGLGASETVTVNPLDTDTFSVNGTDDNGCIATASIVITTKPLPPLTVSPVSAIICQGDFLQLEADGAAFYEWSHGFGTNSSIILDPLESTTIQVTGTAENTCTLTLDIPITVNKKPDLILTGADDPICEGESTSLFVDGASTYIWTDNLGTDPSVFVNPLTTSTYFVTGFSAEGCSNLDSVTVTVNPLPDIILIASQSAICEGEQVAILAEGAVTFLWGGGLGTDAEIFVSPASTTEFVVTGYSLEGCLKEESISIIVHPLPVINLEPTAPIICKDGEITITASGASAYLWNGGLGESASVILQPSETSSYQVTGISTEGCVDSQMIEVRVHVIPVSTQLWPDTQCNSGLYQVTTSAEITALSFPASWVVDTSQMPHFFQISSAPQGTAFSLTLADSLLTCPVSLEINPDIETNPSMPLIYDHCKEEITVLSNCDSGVGDWYRFSLATGQIELIQSSAGTLLEGIDITTRSQFGYMYHCTSPCGGTAFLAPIQEGGFPPCIEAGTFKLFIAPNPASGEFTLEIQHFDASDLIVRIWDISGRLIDEKKILHPGGITRLPMTSSSWASGMYVVSVMDAKDKEVQKQLIIH
jgi:PKD repeat protein